MRGFHYLTLLFALGILGAPRFAAAEKQRIQLDVKERVREKKSKTEKPRLRHSVVYTMQIESKLIDGINKTTAYLEKTAKSLPPKSAQRLQVMEKVLNLYMENASYVRNKEEHDYDAKWRAWDAGGRKGVEPKVDSGGSTNLWKLVISQATEINNEFPQNKSADLVLFNKAIGLNYIEREKDAARILSELVTKYKGSNIAGEAYASLGDYYFDRSDFRNAMNNYRNAMQFPRSQRYLWSIFKLGWCFFNLGQFKEAMAEWKDVVSKSATAGKQGAQVRDEALRDLVYAFAELRMIEEAIAYYKANNGTQYVGTFLMLLGEILADQGQYDQAIKVYKKFESVVPFDPDGPKAQKEVVSLFYVTNRMKNVWGELETFFSHYGRSSAWAKHNKKEDVVETEELIKDQIMYYASITHQKAIKDGNKGLNIEARFGYLLFLRCFPDSKEIPGVKYMLADIEYYLKNYQKAGQYYYEIAALGKDKAQRFNPVTKKFINIHNEVAIEMVGSYVLDFAPEFKILKQKTPNFKKPDKLSEKAVNYIKACGHFMKWYPQDKERSKSCITGIATIYYRSGIEDNAVKYLRDVALKYPGDLEGEASVKLVMPLVKDDNKKLFALTEEFLKVPQYSKSKLGDQLRSLRRGAENDAIVAEKDTMLRARKFEEQAKKYPNDPEVDKLWFNAAVDYMKAGAFSDAVRAHTVIITKFPNKPQAKDSLLTIARINEKQFDFDSASAAYLSFAKAYPKEQAALGALSKSCGLLVAIESDKAVGVCLAFAQKKPDYAVFHIESMIQGQALNGHASSVVNLVTKVYLPNFPLNANQKIVAWKRVYEAAGGKGALAGQALGQMLAIYKSAPNQIEGEALRGIGDIVLGQTLPLVAKYHSLKLTGGTVDALAASIQNRGVGLQQLEGAFQQVLSIKDAYSGVAAYVQMGIANETFAEELSNPPEIKGASRADVLKELMPQINERKKAAINWFQAAVQTVSQFAVYSPYSLKAIDGLARVSGSKFSFDDYVVNPDFVGNEIASNWTKSLRKN